MTLGPVEIIVLAFPENRFTGTILPELKKLVDAGTITIIDGLFVSIGDGHKATFLELDDLSAHGEVASLYDVVDHVEGLLSDDDVERLTEDLPDGSSAAILVFEHTWVTPLRDAIVGAGGILLDSVRISGAAASELQASLVDAA